MSKSKSGEGRGSSGSTHHPPKWPSKTGNPSGKRRDNAPAKKQTKVE